MGGSLFGAGGSTEPIVPTGWPCWVEPAILLGVSLLAGIAVLL